MCLSEFSWSRASRGGTVLLRSIAPRLEDDPPHLVGDQVARVAAGDDEGTQLEISSTELRSLIIAGRDRSEEHTSELQSRFDLVCRLLLEKKKTTRSSTSGGARIMA